MSDYSVHVEARAATGADPIDDVVAITDRLMDLLADHHGVCAAAARSWSVTLSVEGEDPSDACARGSALIVELAARAGLPAWPLVRVEAVRGDVLDDELAHPRLPDLVSGPEAGEVLGVSRQRVHQLAATHADFPAPLYEVAAGKLWDKAAVERFAREWNRRPGRPPADTGTYRSPG